MLDTANADLNVAIKIKREANQTHYTVYRNDSVIGKSKPYKASDSAVKSIHALKRCLAKRKIMDVAEVGGAKRFIVASGNGSIVFESVSFDTEAELEKAAGDLQKFFDAGHPVMRGNTETPVKLD